MRNEYLAVKEIEEMNLKCNFNTWMVKFEQNVGFE